MAATFKVAVLIVKALVKPLAGVLKKNAAEPSWFRTLCMNYGQFHNKMMTRIQVCVVEAPDLQYNRTMSGI